MTLFVAIRVVFGITYLFLGALPPARSTSAGFGGQHAIRTVVGMLSATFLAIFLVPVFFVVALRLFRTSAGPWRK